MPSRNLKKFMTPSSTQEKIGPMTTMVARPVTRTVTSGVTNRSSMSGTWAWSHFSIWHMRKTATTTGMTWP